MINTSSTSSRARFTVEGDPVGKERARLKCLTGDLALCRFADKFSVNQATGCWEWTGARQPTGYGHFWYLKRCWSVHRLMHTLVRGVSLVGVDVCHRCDNPSCANPDHLELGTTSDNMRDMMRKARQSKTLFTSPLTRGERHLNAKLTDAQAMEIRRRFAGGGIRQIELAREYGVPRRIVWSVVHGRTWRHLSPCA